jgi:hypothetical protein
MIFANLEFKTSMVQIGENAKESFKSYCFEEG